MNPVTREREFVLMDEAQEVRLGEQAYPLYTQQSEGLFPDPGLQAYVDRVGRKLAALGHRPDLPYAFNVVNDSAINAYALPGGKISITRGLLSRMENEAQLASVLGHEIGHVTARHAAAGYTRQVLAGLATAVGAAAIQVSGVRGGEWLLKGGALAANLVLMKYSRDQERQADELGMLYMTRAGYNPDGMVQTMEILQAASSREPSAIEAMFQSHPLTSERMATARALAARQAPDLRTADRLRAAPFRQATARLRAVQPAYDEMDRGLKALADDRADEAARLLAEATRRAPDQALIWSMRALAESRAGRNEAAAASAERGAKLDPGLYRARLTAGVLAFKTDRYDESLAHLAAADKLVPGQPTVTFYRGRDHEALGDREAAARAYAAVLEKVREGEMAAYCYKRLEEWGYLKPRR